MNKKLFNKTVISILICMFIIFTINFGSFAVHESYPENIYENMVNASVVLSIGGSGVFIDDNVILTAAHVLGNEKSYKIELRNGTIVKSSDFYIDKKEDIGFIFVDANELKIAKVSSSRLDLGNTVFLVGRPHNEFFKFTLTKGIISHLDRDLPNMGWKDLLQVDAEGGSGSSGSPLYNSDGNLIGMYVGHAGSGGIGISLCENSKSILEAYQRCRNARRN